ncbi:hypothetical protein CPB85DRAFT_1456306, partial [Mucidula mucida]
MPATSFTRAFSRTIRFGSWFFGKPTTSSGDENEELCVLEGDVSYPLLHNITQPLDLDAAFSALPQHSPLDFLELSLLCTAQGIAVVPEEPQTAVLRTAVAAATKVTVIELVEPILVEVEILAPTPTISLTPPTPQKKKPKTDSRSFTPLQNIASAPGTLRPSGKWHGKKHTSRRRAHDKENFAPATTSRTLKTREERLKAYTPPARLLGLRQG